MKREAIMCLDIGGTNCRIGFVDEKYEIYKQTIKSTAVLVENGFMEELKRLIDGYMAEYRSEFWVRAVSLGCPSTIDRSRKRLLSTPNIPGLDNLAVVELLERELGLPVYLERDVNLLLLYDLHYFKLEKQNIVAGIYFGTGIGNGIYMNGSLLYGRNGVAGELGHIPQLYASKSCGCGNKGCLEPLGGGRRLEELCAEEFGSIDIQDIYSLYGDTPEVREQVEAMAIAVATEVNILDPDCVILGGGLLQMKDFPISLLESSIRKHTRQPYPAQNLRLLYSNAGQENGVIGAGIYGWKKWRQEHEKKENIRFGAASLAAESGL